MAARQRITVQTQQSYRQLLCKEHLDLLIALDYRV